MKRHMGIGRASGAAPRRRPPAGRAALRARPVAARQPGHLLRRRAADGRQHLPGRPGLGPHPHAVVAGPQRRVLEGRLRPAVPPSGDGRRLRRRRGERRGPVPEPRIVPRTGCAGCSCSAGPCRCSGSAPWSRSPAPTPRSSPTCARARWPTPTRRSSAPGGRPGRPGRGSPAALRGPPPAAPTVVPVGRGEHGLAGQRTQAVLCVHNLSRFAQPAELALARWAGCTPVEVLGRVPFPVVSDEPYAIVARPLRLSLVRAVRVGGAGVIGAMLDLDEGRREAFVPLLAAWLARRGTAVAGPRRGGGGRGAPRRPPRPARRGGPGRTAASPTSSLGLHGPGDEVRMLRGAEEGRARRVHRRPGRGTGGRRPVGRRPRPAARDRDRRRGARFGHDGGRTTTPRSCSTSRTTRPSRCSRGSPTGPTRRSTCS